MSGDINKNKNKICEVSAFKINLGNGFQVFLYVVSVMVSLGGGKSKNLSKKGQYIEKKRCKEAIEKIITDRGYVYNNQETLYLFKKLDSDIKETIQDPNGDLEVKISFNSKIDITDVTKIRAFLCTALNQFPIKQNKYSFVGNREIYAVKNDDTQESKFFEKYGLVIRHGNCKGVQFINNNTEGILTLDYKKSIFYSGNVNFLEVVKTCKNNMEYDEICELFKNVVLQVKHRPWQCFQFKQFTEKIVKDLKVENQTMVEYYRNMEYYQNQNLDVEYKAVQCHSTCIYPLETLIVVPDQKVSKEKLTKFGIDKKIKKLSAQQRYEAIRKQVKNMELNNVITNAFGIKVSSEMMKVKYFQLPPPSIIAGDNRKIKTKYDESFSFNNNKYYQTSSIENLVIYDCSEKWKNMLQNELKNMKINVKNIKRENGPSDIRSFEEWKQKLANINPAKDYVIVITETQEIHDLLEFLKIKTGIKIQHILENTTHKKCIQNIVHKLNIRAGGFNWKINFEADKLDLNSSTRHKIIIGTDVCRPYSKNKSSKNLIDKAACVGISHNSHFNPFGFETKFFYQNPGQETIDKIKKDHEDTANLFLQKITEILEDFSSDKEADIIYIRDGVSETQYLDVINSEIKIIEKAAEKYFGSTKFKILALIVTKTGNTRFFDTSQKAKIKNLPPRSVITLENRDIYEQFHFIPHFVDSKYSTTKPLMITILKNEVEAETKEIQQFLIALCNLHQSNCGAIGLPAPIFLADKIAYKGHRMLAAYEKYIPQNDRIIEDHEDFYNLLTLSIMKRFEGEELQQPQQHQH